MTGKTVIEYTAVFKYLHENIMPLNYTTFMSDYEQALRKGFSNVVPGVQMTACWFHFTKV